MIVFDKGLANRLPVALCLKIFTVLMLGMLMQSCASYGSHATTMRDGLLTGYPELSLAIAEDKDPDQEEVISSLDKGMLRRINNNYTGSNQILEVAKQEIEKLYGFSVTENLASITINETLQGYEGDRYEQLLLHAYMAMNYIQLGQLDGARVEMLQANVKMMEWGDEPEEDAFLRYLEGIIYEGLGEQDSALISYRKAYTVYKEKGGAQYPVAAELIKKDLLRLLAWQGLWSEYKTYKKEFDMSDYKPVKESNKLGCFGLMVTVSSITSTTIPAALTSSICILCSPAGSSTLCSCTSCGSVVQLLVSARSVARLVTVINSPAIELLSDAVF